MAAPREIDIIFLAAARNGDMSTLQRLLEEYENGEGPGKVQYTRLRSRHGYNALHLAAQKGKTAVCQFLIQNLKFDINEADCGAHGDTALFLSVENKHQPTTIFLLENGADVTKHNIFNETPLYYAAKTGSKETVKLLLSSGADLNAISDWGMPLQAAALCGNHDTVKYLLNLKADPNPTNSSHELTPLFAALKSKSRESVKLLLEAGADPNLPCYMTTPLKYASCQLNVEIVKCLLEFGADPNTPDSVGNKPIESAAFVFRSEVVKLLFPVTSPIPKYPHWSTSEVNKYQKTMEAVTQYASKFKEVIQLANAKAGEAFRRKNYLDAVGWYMQASLTGEVDAKLLLNRSMCCSKMNLGDQALADAQECIKREPGWAKAHYREGVAWSVLKNFTKAAKSFAVALAREPGNKEIKKAYMEAQARSNKFKHWNEEYIRNESPEFAI